VATARRETVRVRRAARTRLVCLMGSDRRGCGDRPGIVEVNAGRQHAVGRTPASSATGEGLLPG